MSARVSSTTIGTESCAAAPSRIRAKRARRDVLLHPAWAIGEVLAIQWDQADIAQGTTKKSASNLRCSGEE